MIGMARNSAPFAGARMTGYEIHNGRTTVNGEPFCRLADGTPEGCVCKNVFGTYLHGLFDSGELTQALVKLLCARKGISPRETRPTSMAEYRQARLTCWPTACARRWIWARCIARWG